MEESWTDWLFDMETDDYSFMNQQSDTNVEKGTSPSKHGIANSLVADSSLEIRPSKLLKASNSSISSSSPSSHILSFELALKPETKVMNHGAVPLNPKDNELGRGVVQEGKKNGSLARSRYCNPDHITTERMRRQNIGKQFIALSALIPDLKKIDKVSVVGGAIKYLKQLKEQVKVLEEEQSKEKSVESLVFVDEKAKISNTFLNSFNENSDDPSSRINTSLPKVEARVSEKNVLIQILLEKEKAVLTNVVREIEKLHLSVIKSSSFTFGSSFLVITTIAEMEDEFNMNVKTLAKTLRVGLMQFM